MPSSLTHTAFEVIKTKVTYLLAEQNDEGKIQRGGEWRGWGGERLKDSKRLIAPRSWPPTYYCFYDQVKMSLVILGAPL